MNSVSQQHALEQYFPASALTDEHQLTQLRLLARRIRSASIPQLKSLLAGNHTSKQKGRGLDLDQLRIYQPGDDIRSIDWRVTARTQKPHTRIYREERERPIIILCDQRNPMFFGTQRSFKSVVAAQCAALLAWSALDHGDRVGAVILSNQQEWDFRPKQRAQHVLQIIKSLNECNHALQHKAPMSVALSDSLRNLHRSIPPGSTVYLISDFFDLDESAREALYNLKRHNHVVALQVYDDYERKALPPGVYPVTDGEQSGILNTGSTATQRQYVQAQSQWQATIDRLFKQLSVPHHSVPAAGIPYDALRVALSQGGHA